MSRCIAKDFVQASRDIPNRYPWGQILILDSEMIRSRWMVLRGLQDVVQGFKLLASPPGKKVNLRSIAQLGQTKPTVTIEFEERVAIMF